MPTDDALFDAPDSYEAGGAVWGSAPSSGGDVERVARWFTDHPDLEDRFSTVFRQSFDEVMDGQRTGRYDVNVLEKTEKTYLGTKVEIVCRAAFGLARGERMDYRVCGVDVDAKFSLDGKWMIPREAMGHLCLLMAANDRESVFTVGLVRIREDILTQGGNQDHKRNISAAGRSAIKWLFKKGKLRRNLLLGLDDATRNALENVSAGQNRVDQLFRQVHERVIDRNAVVTAAKQLDAPKRVRDARHRLAPEGVIILGHQNESPRIAKALKLPVPEKGTWVAARVVPAPMATDRPQVLIGDASYVIAEPGEPRRPAPSIRY
ncbi:NaeI family type II restriction endonuclease [Streptomyces sp. NPDC002402]